MFFDKLIKDKKDGQTEKREINIETKEYQKDLES